MSIITLTTDFGTKDHFVGAVKGSIYNELAEAKVVDISHHITPFSVTQTAYVLKNADKNFPKGTIHIIGVDSEISVENKPIAILLDGQYFIGCDNGILSLITNEIRPEKMVEITIPDPEEYQFAILGKFIKVACHIARGGMLEVIGMQIDSIKEIVEIQPFINSEKNQILGSVIYIHNFVNVVSNISKSVFSDVGKGREFEIVARNYRFTQVYKRYNEVVDYSVPQEKR